MSERVTITIDGKEIEVDSGDLLIQAAEENGTYIPRFCWHNRMKPVGMCRMCLVEVEGPRGTMLTTSCTMPVNDGMVVYTTSDTVKKAQEGVLEFLLLNHPLDCPVCDRGGECPLQDQTMSHGPGESRFVEEKRHFEKPIPISDLVLLDRERCILCARCTRFSDEISGDPLIEFIDRGNYTQVNTFPDEPFASYFSGNTVQICPVGALTATPYRFRARPWDLEAVESTCAGCSVGCRVSVQASQNEILRLLGVDIEPTNHGWLCDKGRFGFQHLAAEERLTTPLVRDGDELREASWAEALDRAGDGLRAAMDAGGPGSVAGLGGARNTNEEALAFSRLLRDTIGTPHVDSRLGDSLDPGLMANGPQRGLIGDLERAATVFVWAPDLKEELPVLYLRARRAATELGAALVVVHPRRTGLDDVADHVVRYRPGEGADLLDRLRSGDGDLAEVAETLSSGPVVAIVGRTGLAEDASLANAVTAYAAGLPDATVLPVTRRPNAYGAVDMGLAPGVGPGRVSVEDGHDADGILGGLADGSLGAVVLLGSDPASDHPSGGGAESLDAAGFVVAIDMFLTESSRRADVVLPAAAFGEVEGTMTNLEGRVQKLNQIVPTPGQGRPANEILGDLAARLGASWESSSAAAFAAAIAALPGFGEVGWDSLDWGAGRDGIVVHGGEVSPTTAESSAASPEEFALHLARVLYDKGTATAMGPSLAKLAPGPKVFLNPGDAERLGVNGRARVAGSAGSVELDTAIDPTLAAGTVYVPFNLGVSIGNEVSVTVEAVS